MTTNVEITFRVFGTTHDELDAEARKELERFGGPADAWEMTIEAKAAQTINRIVGYDGTVTAWRTHEHGWTAWH